MSEQICANVSIYRHGRLQQGYSLNGDRAYILVRSRGFSIEINIEDNAVEDRPQAVVKVCGHTLFDTERQLVSAVIDSLTALEQLVIEEAKASLVLDGQTQSDGITGAEHSEAEVSSR